MNTKKQNIFVNTFDIHNANTVGFNYPATFSASKNTPYVEGSPKDYQVGVTNFAISMDTVPLFVALPSGKNSVSELAYIASIGTGTGKPVSVNLEMFQQFASGTIQVPIIPTDPNNRTGYPLYYSVYEYSQLVYMVLVANQKALKTLMSAPIAWSGVTNYNKYDSVTFGGNSYYSNSQVNINQTPGVSADWSLYDSPANYNSGTAYGEWDIIKYNGVGYYSKVGSNTGNQPDISPTQWAVVSEPYLVYDLTLKLFANVTPKAYSKSAIPLWQYYNLALYQKFLFVTERDNPNDPITTYKLYTGVNQAVTHVTASNLMTIPGDFPGEGLPAYYNVGEVTDNGQATDLVSVIVSTTMPICDQGIDNSLNVGYFQQQRKIIATYFPPNPAFRGVMTYNPPFVRFHDMNSEKELTQMGLTIQWVDILGNTFDIYIDPIDTASVQLVFHRRDATLEMADSVLELANAINGEN